MVVKFFNLVLKKYGKWILEMCGNPEQEEFCLSCRSFRLLAQQTSSSTVSSSKAVFEIHCWYFALFSEASWQNCRKNIASVETNPCYLEWCWSRPKPYLILTWPSRCKQQIKFRPKLQNQSMCWRLVPLTMKRNVTKQLCVCLAVYELSCLVVLKLALPE